MGQAGPLVSRIWRQAPYLDCLAEMRAFTSHRQPDTPDEVWLVEHPPVFTLGLAASPDHVLNAHPIAVVQTDRGGEVTYHGPGQLVVYPLLDLRRRGLYVRELVRQLEESLLDLLRGYGLQQAQRVTGEPGIYLPKPSATSPRSTPTVDASADDWVAAWSKIAALGLKVKNGCCYHGYALNIEMDLSPFDRIHPCGHRGLQTIDLATMGIRRPWDEVAQDALSHLQQRLQTKA